MNKIYTQVAIIVLFLSSCVPVSRLDQNSAFLPPINIDSSVTDAAQESYFKLGEWPEAAWWQCFNDENLTSLMSLALEHNPSIEAVKQKVEVAKQVVVQKKSSLFPAIFLDAQENWGRISKNGLYHALNPALALPYNLLDLNLSFTYEFDFWGKNRNLFQAALGFERSQKAETKQVELMITTALAQAYFALKTNLKRKELLKELYNLQDKEVKLVNLLNQNAMSSKIEPATFVESLEEIDKRLISIEEEVIANIHLVNFLTGRGPNEQIELSSQLQELPNSIDLPNELSSQLLVRRPDLMASIWRVQALAREANAAVADFFPRVNLLGLLGLESIGYKNLFDWVSRQGWLIPTIHLPIFNAKSIRARFKMKKAELQEAIYNYNHLFLRSLQEVTDSLVWMKSWYEKRAKQKVILEKAALKTNLYQSLQQIGIDNLIQVYQIQSEYVEKQLEEVEIIYNQYVSVVQLIKSIGGGYSAEDQKYLKVGRDK